MSSDKYRRGAAGQQYAIMVGLIAVVAILAISSAGTSVQSLMARTANTLGNVNAVSGSGGGGGGYAHAQVDGMVGGAGGFVSGTMSVTPGQTLVVMVGRAGLGASTGAAGASGTGGGRSAIRFGGVDLVTAGGGGGSSYLGALASTSAIQSTGAAAPNSADPDYVSGVAIGGPVNTASLGGGSGGNGLVVISW